MNRNLSSEEKGLVTADLCEAGIAMMKQSLVRRHSEDDAETVQWEFENWLYRKSDPVPGDVSGDVCVRQGVP